MRLSLLAFLLLTCALHADEDAKMEKAAKAVKIFRHSDPPSSCKEMEDIEAPDISVMDEVMTERMLRRMAAQKGANAMQVIGKRTATIYKCKESGK
jgi:hypothetical protein